MAQHGASRSTELYLMGCHGAPFYAGVFNHGMMGERLHPASMAPPPWPCWGWSGAPGRGGTHSWESRAAHSQGSDVALICCHHPGNSLHTQLQ